MPHLRLFKFIIPVLLIAASVLLGRQYSYGENNEKGCLWPNKSDFSALRRKTRQTAYVYSNRSPKAAEMQNALQNLAQHSRYIRVLPTAFEKLTGLDEAVSLCFVGTPETHAGVESFLRQSGFRLSLSADAIEFNGQKYAGRDLLFLCAAPNVAYPGRFFRLIVAAKSETLLSAFSSVSRFPQLIGDYSIYRKGQLLAYGFFNQLQINQPWKVVRTIHLRKSAMPDTKRGNAIFNIRFVGKKPPAHLLKAFIASREQWVIELLQQLQLDKSIHERILPLNLDIYETTEKKFLSTRLTGFSSWNPEQNSITVVLNTRLPGHDFTAFAECLMEKAWGRVKNEKLLHAAGILFSRAWGRSGYRFWANRLFSQNLFPDLPSYLQQQSSVSNMTGGIALATYLEFLFKSDGISIFRDFLKKIPSSNNYDFITVFPDRKKRQWRRWCRQNFHPVELEKIIPVEEFLAGFCYAHEGYNIYNGYLGSASEKALKKLATLNVNAISLTPFAYFGSKKVLHKSDSVRQENDESLIVAGQYARALGMKIMLKPHIWVSWRSWPGDIDFETEMEVDRFFTSYGNLMLHYAMLAQMQQFESLCIGVEFVKLTQRYENRWRDLIAKVRKVYSGQLIYAANWGQEFENIKFWDALDAIGLNSYYPLSKKDEFDRGEIEKSLQRIFTKIKQVKQKFNRPVYFTEVGFASRPVSWRNPHIDGHNKAVDLVAQQQCFQVLLSHIAVNGAVDGLFIWKWPTHLGVGGKNHSSFTPNGKPAEQEIRKYYHTLLQ